MELTPSQRRLVFAVIVLVLVGLGIYLLNGRGSGGTPAAAPATSAGTAAPSAGTSSASVPPSVVPTPSPVSTVGGAEIYQWLPFTPADLTAAAQATTSFAADYVTWSYKENAAAYGATMRGLVTATELTSIEAGYETPGVASARAADKQVSTGSGTINSISSFSATPTSITFLVTINQQVTSTQPTPTQGNQYTVTVVSSGGGWQVSSINLSGLGNS
jgi:hypothetical protein